MIKNRFSFLLFISLIAGIAEGQLMQMTCEDMQCDVQCVQQYKCREARCEWMNNQYGRGESPPYVYYTTCIIPQSINKTG